MPVVHDAHPTSILDYIDLQLVEKWERCPGEKLLTQAFDNLALSPDLLSGIRNRIFAAVSEITQSKSVGVAAPLPSEVATHARHTPTAFLVYNLTLQQREQLISRYVWASPNISFRVIPLNPPCPDFLFALKDFAIMLEQDVYELVYAVWNDKDSSDFLASLAEEELRRHGRDIQSSLRIFTASMSVTRLDTKGRGDTPAPHFNIFANGSTIQDDSNWCNIRSYLANRIYSSPLLGRATTLLTPFNCTLCHGVDHPRGLCTFPNVVGWNGPPLHPNNSSRRFSDNHN